MSHNLQGKSLRSEFTLGLPISSERSCDTDTVNAVESDLRNDSKTVCDSPVCSVRFDQTGMAISPKRFCGNACKMDVWAIKRVSRLFEDLTDDEALRIIRGGR